ncbi:uncharacterized protein [Lepeophtheirus salmonis]|uniref:uncharacterized protein isoform X2 n=1 Tax=Lepeophtheirus salmonis TaxID=72036 RepID=UPI003AF3327E
MSTAYSDSSMSDDDGSFFQYPSGLQKQISLGKHGLETAPMFRLRKTRPPFTLQRESSFSSDGEDELEDDGFREMTAENLFSTLLTRVKSLTRRIHDEHEEHINTWHQNQRIVNHPLNPGDTHARLERSALRNSIKRLPMNKRPTYDETPLPSTIPSENLDLACGVSVTSKQRSRPGYLPHPNAERIIPINLVNSHDKFDQYYSASPPIKRINDIMIPSNDLTYGEEDRQRRVSRFLRPDFYDTPKEDSIYAKMKELEEEEKRKSRFLKKIQARNASESCDVLSPLSSLSNQDDVIMPLHTPSNGEGQFSSNVSRDKEQLTSQVLVNPSSKVSFHCPQPFVAHNKPISSDNPSCPVPISELNKRRIIYPYGGAKSDGPLNKHALISNSIIAAAERKKRETYGRSTTMELPKKAVNQSS